MPSEPRQGPPSSPVFKANTTLRGWHRHDITWAQDDPHPPRQQETEGFTEGMLGRWQNQNVD